MKKKKRKKNGLCSQTDRATVMPLSVCVILLSKMGLATPSSPSCWETVGGKSC